VDCNIDSDRIKVKTAIQWISELVDKVREGDEQGHLHKEISAVEDENRRVQTEIIRLRNDRRKRILTIFSNTPEAAKTVDNFETIDDLNFDSIKQKKAISAGAFLNVDQKREHVKQQLELQKKLDYVNNYVSMLPEKEGGPVEMRKLMKTLDELFGRSAEIEIKLKKLHEKLHEVQKKQAMVPVGEIELKVTDELDYMRDLTRLAARRIGLEAFPLVRAEDKVFSLKSLNASLNQITEFDPHIFKNGRVPLFGRPYVLLMPGIGNGVFDYKNNCIILPVIAPNGNFMGSLSTGIIDYRLDADEDKKLLTSYNQLPDLKDVRSIITLKASLTKDYITWMTSEYKGFRILSKEAKNWFEYEVGPSKNDIYTPLEFQSYVMSSADFKKMLDGIEERLKELGEDKIGPPEDLWAGALLYYQQGKSDKSCVLLEKLVKVQPENLMAWYNLGFVAMKLMNRSLAKGAFEEFCKKDTQSWWSKVARDHLRTLAG
jgi:tetratricopeptide (TPR) repeat protein